jgi:hypothetical protein
MTYRIDLSVCVEDALAELTDEEQRAVLETVATVLVRREVWPMPDGWDTAAFCSARSQITFAAYADGIDVLDICRLDKGVIALQPDGSPDH